jgi:NADPH-dependent 2,4-dienoyl-CoA reductase/sulfur reductase-like enzyme/rhodanese-related sulfurtransferase
MANSQKKSDVVIIGGVAAGPKTAAVLARRMPSAAITLYEAGEHISYGTCGLPYFAGGIINSIDELSMTSYGVKRDAEFFRKSKGVEVITGASVLRINHNRKSVSVEITRTGEKYNHSYGKLVLATGSKPGKPDFPVPDSPRIKYFARPEDAIAFRDAAQKGDIGKAVFIGAGFTGCELAEAAGDLWGIEVTLIEKENQLLPNMLDREMALLVADAMKRNGVKVMTGVKIAAIDLDGESRPVIHFEEGPDIGADFVFLCMGVRPNSDLAREAGLEIGHTGGIVVNGSMQTSDPDIYAGGDCTESISRLTWERFHLPMGSLANRHGRIIAENLSGGKSKFQGVLGAVLLKAFDINVGAVGITVKKATQAGINAVAVWGTFPDKPDFYPENKTITVKMIFDKENEKLLGLQAVGAGDVCRPVDVFSAFLQHKARVDDLLDFEHGYAPPYSEALSPLFHLASMAKAGMRGINFLDPGTDLSMLGENVTFLDVRQPEEFESEPISRNIAINIPLNDLKDRLAELNRGGKIVLICKRGPRAYQAAHILKNAGFNEVYILGGGIGAVGTGEKSLSGVSI